MRSGSIDRFTRLAVILAILAVAAAGCSPETGATRTPTATSGPLSDAYSRVLGPQSLRFPEDDGPHEEYLTEWWYYTGNLDTADGRHFGFQLTFFRRAAVPQEYLQDRDSAWAAGQIYLAHFALTDVAGGQFHAAERFSRGAAGLAGAQADPYRVWLENWSVEAGPGGGYLLKASDGGRAIELVLKDARGRTLHGDGGYSRKGPDPGNASTYISQARLEAAGTVMVDGVRHEVSGLAWMDHEYGTSALGPEEIGWDWFSMQLDDGSELMLFQLRRAGGGISLYSSGTLVEPDGTTVHLGVNDFTITVDDRWTSPHSGAEYPAAWTVEVPSAGIVIEIEPYLNDQELQVSFVYWEGAVRVEGSRDGLALSGSGYVELTGYAHSMQGEF
ncbi:MAG TPA: lipocalin-like domain-containing protein [Anaerolineales bacterium]|nr:lipocalin-like domain-containing protein [Anaerolineales bacterium]